MDIGVTATKLQVFHYPSARWPMDILKLSVNETDERASWNTRVDRALLPFWEGTDDNSRTKYTT